MRDHIIKWSQHCYEVINIFISKSLNIENEFENFFFMLIDFEKDIKQYFDYSEKLKIIDIILKIHESLSIMIKYINPIYSIIGQTESISISNNNIIINEEFFPTQIEIPNFKIINFLEYSKQIFLPDQAPIENIIISGVNKSKLNRYKSKSNEINSFLFYLLPIFNDFISSNLENQFIEKNYQVFIECFDFIEIEFSILLLLFEKIFFL